MRHKYGAEARLAGAHIWGVGLTVINMLAGNPINPINCGAIAMVGGFPVVWLVSLFTKKLPLQTVDKIFECYD